MGDTLVKKAAIYKLYNNKDEPLYIGMSFNVFKRLENHCKKSWFKDVEYVKVSQYLNKNTTHIYEIFYIANEEPKHNLEFSNGGTVELPIKDIEFEVFNKDQIDKNIKKARTEYFHYLNNRPGVERFVNYINRNWLVPEGCKDNRKYRIYKVDDKRDIVKKARKCKILGGKKSKYTFIGIVKFMNKKLGYVIEDKKSAHNNKYYRYKLITEHDKSNMEDE